MKFIGDTASCITLKVEEGFFKIAYYFWKVQIMGACVKQDTDLYQTRYKTDSLKYS